MPDLDQIALDTVEAIAKIDPDKLKGGRVRAMAQAQCLVRDAMRVVEAERDEAFAKGKQAFEDLRRVEAEHNSLAAYVEDVRAAYISGGQWAERVIAIGRVLNQSPTTALARRDMSVMAETLEKMARRECGWTQNEIAEQAAELRRQAEEDKP